MTARIDAIRRGVDEQRLDGLLVSQAENRRYLSGFTGSSGVLLITPSQTYIVTDSRYYEQAGREAANWQLVRQTGNPAPTIGTLLKEANLGRIGFEAEAVTVAEIGRWQAEAPAELEWVPTEGLVSRVRASKDEQELELLRQAQTIADAAYERLLTLIQPGKSEKQVAWELELALRELGADGPAFPIIVASGPNAALPHYRPGDREIGRDEIVLVDYGARLQGYHSDCTRTFFTGDPAANPRFVSIYNTCLDAVGAAEEGIHAGIGARAADALARDAIAAAGHGEAFGHGLGHGIGLAVHEAPSVSYRAAEDDVLPAESAITIEPGIYYPGWGGVRIEDLAIVRENGVEVLTRASKHIDAWRRANATG